MWKPSRVGIRGSLSGCCVLYTQNRMDFLLAWWTKEAPAFLPLLPSPQTSKAHVPLVPLEKGIDSLKP